jgi:transcriptional regulator with XRE-family HTH domain
MQTDSFSSRIRRVLGHYELSAYKLGKEISITNATALNLVSGKVNPSFDVLSRLKMRYPELNANWLLVGEGHMFLDPNLNPNVNTVFPPDLIESKNELIAALNENIRIKDEQLQQLREELRAYRAASDLMKSKERISEDEVKKAG